MAESGLNNLQSFDTMDKDKALEIKRKGQIASVESRRRKKNLKEVARMLLEMEIPPTQAQTKAQMTSLGVCDEDMTYAMQIMIAMLSKAVKGDVNAAKFIRETSGLNLDDTAERLLEAKEDEEDVLIYLPDNGRDDIGKKENK